MPALNFKAQFANDITFGNKRQTVRATRKDGRAHAKVGDTIKLYTGMRTKACRLLAEATVTHIEKIRIEPTCMFFNDHPVFSVIHDRDGPLTDNEFAEANGFAGFTEMANWFDDMHGLPFEGTVIYWDEPR